MSVICLAISRGQLRISTKLEGKTSTTALTIRPPTVSEKCISNSHNSFEVDLGGQLRVRGAVTEEELFPIGQDEVVVEITD